MDEDSTGIDQAGIRDLQAAMGSGFAELFQYFVEDMTTYHEQLAEALETNRFDEGRRIAHAVKSTSLLFGHPKISEQAKDLEDAFVSGDRLPEKLTILRESLTDHIEQLKHMLTPR